MLGIKLKLGYTDAVVSSCCVASFCLCFYAFFWGGELAEWLASPDWDRKVVGSNPGVAKSNGQ